MRLFLAITLALAITGCSTTPKPDLGIAPAARMPDLPDYLASPAIPLPPLVDGKQQTVILDGLSSDAEYGALARRYNLLLKVWTCVQGGLAKRSETETERCLSED